MLLATGGFGRMFRVTSNAWTSPATACRSRTATASRCRTWSSTSSTRPGIVGIGILLSEAARGEGGYLLDNDGFRFMERYAPKLMELAPRDMVSRAIVQEIRAGRGIDGKDYVYLDVRHLGRKVIEEKLPDITDFARVYQGVEPLTEPVPIQPTAHYAMGGIPTDLRRPGHPGRGQHGRAGPVRGGRVRHASPSTARTGWDQLARRPARVRPTRRAPMAADVARRGACRTSTTHGHRARPRGARGDPVAHGRGAGGRASARSWPT